MSGYCRTVLSTLCRSLGRQPSKTFHGIKVDLSQTRSLGLSVDRCELSRYHHWSNDHRRTAFLNVNSTWRSCHSSSQRDQSSEAGAPKKEDDYPPLPDYDANQPESKEVFVVSVKGLPYSCKKEDLLEFFSECRVREGLKGVHFLYHRDGRPKGQAFIEVETEEDVSKALERHRQYLGPRYVEVFEVTDQDAEALLKGGDSPLAGGSVVRLRGLPFTSTEEDIVQFFSGLDIIESGVTLLHNARGQSIGQAFVQFASQEMAEKALERDRALMGHRYVEVFSSSTSELASQLRRRQQQRPAAPPSDRAPPQYTSPPLRTPLPPQNPPVAPPMDMARSQQLRAGRSAATQAPGTPIHYIHMRGLPFEATAEDIVQFFAPLRVARIMVEYHSDGKASGEAEVHFRSHEDAVAAMSKDREYMQNRYIELFLNSSRG